MLRSAQASAVGRSPGSTHESRFCERAEADLAMHAERAWPAVHREVIVFDAELWLWDARRTDTWIFVSLPTSESEEIRDLVSGLRRGFGSVRVRATIGTSIWTTSIFPSSQVSYVLPVKRAVRVAEALDVGDMAAVTVELIDFPSDPAIS